MEKIIEENKNLMNLRTSLITVLIVLTSGLVGLLLGKIDSIRFYTLFTIGIYFDFLFLKNVLDINEKIKDNMRNL
ncbi:hypothetical protein IJ182_00065 [bacterium]|nr:hypothetical protein [bacterium]